MIPVLVCHCGFPASISGDLRYIAGMLTAISRDDEGAASSMSSLQSRHTFSSR
jgi:hypothetical protein